MEVVGGNLRLRRRALPEGQEQVWVLVVGEHERNRALDMRQPRVQQRPARAGGIDDVAVAEQDQRVNAVVFHGRSQAGTAFAVHPGEVRQIGYVDQLLLADDAAVENVVI